MAATFAELSRPQLLLQLRSLVEDCGVLISDCPEYIWRVAMRKPPSAPGIPPKNVDEILTNHFSGKINEQRRLWALMSLEVWYQTFFGSDVYEPEVS